MAAAQQNQQSLEDILSSHEAEMAVMGRRLQSLEGRLTTQASESAKGLVTITQNDAIFGSLGAAAGAGGVFVAGKLGYIAATPTRMVIGGVVGLAVGVGGSRYWNRQK